MATRLTLVRIVSQIRAELDRILEVESSLSGGLSEGSELLPRVDVVQTDSRLCLLVEVPGATADDLEIAIANNVVSVSGEKCAGASSRDGARFLRVERQWGQFERAIELPSPVNPRDGHAWLDNGVLRIEFPLLSDQRRQIYRLEIEAGDGGIVA